MKTSAPGLELRVGLSFVGFVCAYYYLDPAETFLPFFAAVAVHELGHLLVLLALGTPVYALELHATGAILRTGPRRPAGRWPACSCCSPRRASTGGCF